MSDRKDPTYAELKAKLAEMEKQFKSELAEMAKRVEQARKNEQAGAVEQIKALMQNFGISATDLGAGKAKKTKATGSVPVKYRGPNGETWTGRGRAPNWIAGVADREQFKV
jgi:DNA-binding protein H-NS